MFLKPPRHKGTKTLSDCHPERRRGIFCFLMKKDSSASPRNDSKNMNSFVSLCLGGFYILTLSACVTTTQTPAPTYDYGLYGGAGSTGAHTAMAGDTVGSIAQRYRLNVQDIVYKNGLQPPYRLTPGQRLLLPPPQTYRTKPDDTLYSVSRLFGVSTTDLTRLNGLHAPYALASGTTLRLPPVREAVRSIVASYPVEAADDRVVKTALPVPLVKAEVLKQTVGAGGPFIWPVDGPVISSFGPKKSGVQNDGINIGAARGTPVLAAENGEVVYAGDQLKGYGNLVLIRHADRWVTAYAHMDRLLVRRGDAVRRGQALGSVGRTGAVDSSQLHFEIRHDTEVVDPQSRLAPRRT